MRFWGGWVLLLCLLGACAEERPFKPIVDNPARISKKALGGDFYFLKSVIEVKAPGKQFAALRPGTYLRTNSLIRFEIKERSLDIVNQVRSLQNNRPAEKNPVLASFTCRSVDVLRKQNVDGVDTHEEEETETRRPWAERDNVVFDGGLDAQDDFIKETLSAQMENVRIEEGSLRFDVVRQLSDGTSARERYHFLAKRPSAYVARPYPLNIQQRFGFFRTTQPGFDSYQQPSQLENVDWMNLRSLQGPVRYHIDPSFPDHLKGGVRTAVDQWNLAFKQATEKTPLETNFEATADKRGDLRFNVIIYDDAIDSGHGVLGYAPTFSDPTTGELIKGDIYIYGGTLAWARLAEESWRRTKVGAALPPASSPADITVVLPKGPIESDALSYFLGPYRALAIGVPRLENDGLAEQVRKFSQPERMLENARAVFNGEQRERLTYWEAGAPLVSQSAAENPVALEQKIFPPLIAHEMGHTLGLRHNFKGSADYRHITRGKSSTVMDYGFLASEETHEIGQYDYAAIEMGYGNRKSEQKRLRAENFYFCSDENVFNSKDGMCLPYDTGKTLTEILDSLYRRYVGSYHFLNLRLDRMYFDESQENYIRKVGSLLLPIRQIYDHASAILVAAQAKNAGPLWRLTGARIEKDNGADEVVPLDPGKEGKVPGKDMTDANLPTLDATKIDQVVSDAREAKKLAVAILYQIVFKREPNGATAGLQKLLGNRSDVDFTDDANTLWVRGILADRLIALSLLISPSPDPLGNVVLRSVAVTYGQGLAAAERDGFNTQLSSVISNSYFEQALAGRRILPISPPLPNAIRRYAMKWAAQDLGYYSEGVLLPLLRIEKQSMPFPLLGLTDLTLLGAHLGLTEDAKRTARALVPAQKTMLTGLADILRPKAYDKDKEKALLKQLGQTERVVLDSVSLAVPSNSSKELLRTFRNRKGPSALMMHAISHLFRGELYRQAYELSADLANADIKAEEDKEEFDRDRVSVEQWKNQAADSLKKAEDLELFLAAERTLMESAYELFKGKTTE